MPNVNRNAFLPVMLPDMPPKEFLFPYLEAIDEAQIYSNFGPLETKMRESIAQFVDCVSPPAIVTLANATLGLELLIENLNLPLGSFICMPAFTFAATATAVKRCGHNIVLADVDEDDWLLTPEIVMEVMNKQRVDAVIVVSTFGRCVDENLWDHFFLETGCPVIFDAATALGNQKPGCYCPAVYSLHATKALSAGEGGVIAIRNTSIGYDLREKTNFGFQLNAQPRVALQAHSLNAKLSEYHAAVFLAALETWPTKKKWRDNLESCYRIGFFNSSLDVQFQGPQKNMINNYMNVCLPAKVDISLVIDKLTTRGVGSHRWYLPLINFHPAFSDAIKPLITENCDKLASDMISLPFHYQVIPDDVDYIIEAVEWAVGE